MNSLWFPGLLTLFLAAPAAAQEALAYASRIVF